MANPEHLEILKQGVAQWNKWREEHANVPLDLYDADLSGTNLSRAYLVASSAANLGRANLSGTDLREANLSGPPRGCILAGKPSRREPRAAQASAVSRTSYRRTSAERTSPGLT